MSNSLFIFSKNVKAIINLTVKKELTDSNDYDCLLVKY